MENGGYRFKKITEDITLLYGFPEECCMYAVKGRDKILLVDTGMGTGDLNRALAVLGGGLPVLVFNTHGHADHCGGNRQFPEIYLHEGSYADADRAEEEKKTLPGAEPVEGILDYDWRKCPVHEGDVFDLGGKTIEVLETPGHTPGCISLLDAEDRILFGGDLVVSNDHCSHMLAYVEWFSFSTVSVETWYRSLQKIKARQKDWDYILGGHDAFLLKPYYLDELLDMCRDILNGTARPYHPQLKPVYGNISCWKLEREHTAILYHDEVIFDKK
ncbi:MAG: MBL fold metallo-hydrolase [Eubacterium sp.]|nr:MBL fold metallo-hydrolase [Eubacterium sp.]